jgi:CheY-like chemotaxis protein
MSERFCFIGDPGPHKSGMLETLRSAGLHPTRVEPSAEGIEELLAEPPAAVAIGTDVGNRAALVVGLRERSALDGVPLLARVEEPDSALVEAAFLDGADDVLVDGAIAQFSALVSRISDRDSWDAVRAPAGLVLLADADRKERIRLGHVLRRNGFDLRFAATTSELENWLSEEEEPRAVVASAEIPGGSLAEVFTRIAGERRGRVPWVVVNAVEDVREAIRERSGDSLRVVFDSGRNAERITFLMNELLAPEPQRERRTPRLLYETLVTFVHEESTARFFGHSYNVNLGGVFIRTLTPPPSQSRIEVRFRPPCGRGDVVGVAQVVWRREFASSGGPASPPGVGVQFVEWSPADSAGYEGGYSALLEMHGVETRAPAASDLPTAYPPRPPYYTD